MFRSLFGSYSYICLRSNFWCLIGLNGFYIIFCCCCCFLIFALSRQRNERDLVFARSCGIPRSIARGTAITQENAKKAKIFWLKVLFGQTWEGNCFHTSAHQNSAQCVWILYIYFKYWSRDVYTLKSDQQHTDTHKKREKINGKNIQNSKVFSLHFEEWLLNFEKGHLQVLVCLPNLI